MAGEEGATADQLGLRLGWAVAAAAAAAVFMAWWLHWFGLVDLEVYRSGAVAFLHGRDVYLAHPRVVPLPFTYPPFAAVFFVPLGVLPDSIARVAMSLLSGAALVWAALAALRLAAPTWPLRARATVALGIAAATPLLEPVRDTFRLGQVNLVLMALVLADLVAILATDAAIDPAGDADRGHDAVDPARASGTEDAQARRPAELRGRKAVRAAPPLQRSGSPGEPRRSGSDRARASSAAERDRRRRRLGGLPGGVLLGLATAVKLTPGIFILYLLVLRRTREAIIAMGAALAATLLAAVFMPAESDHYWRHLVFDDRRIGSPGNVWNQSLRGALARLTGSPDRAHLLWLALAVAVAVGGLALAGAVHRGGEPLLGLGLAALTGLLVSPISWNHHWVWFIPLAIGLTRRAVVTGRRLDRWVAVGWVATFCVASMSWWPFAHQDNYRLGPAYTVAADCYVLAALVLVGVLGQRAWFAPRLPRPARPEAGA